MKRNKVKYCEKCGTITDIIDSRSRENYLYRRRECKNCGNRYSTREVLIEDNRRSEEDDFLLS